MNAITQTFLCPRFLFRELETKFLAPLTRKAAKIAGFEFSYSLGEEEYHAEITYPDCFAVMVPVTVSSLTPRLPGGWKLLGVCKWDHAEGNFTYRMVPGSDLPTTWVHPTEPTCQHCNLSRRRNDTFILQGANGETKIVGANCIEDFLGHHGIAGIMALAEFLDSNEAIKQWLEFMAAKNGPGNGDGDFEHGSRVSLAFKVDLFTAATWACAEKFGWTSKADSGIDRTSTADRACQQLTDKGKLKESEKAPVTDLHREKARLALEWAKAIPDTDTRTNTYLFNLRTLADRLYIGLDNRNFLASLYAAYMKAHPASSPVKAATVAHFGTPGQRDTFNLIFIESRFLDTQFGTFLVKFVDQYGNPATWFASNNPELTEGHTYKVKATVKSHGEFAGKPQTVLTRCAVS